MIVQMASTVCMCPAAPVCLPARATQPETYAAPSVSHGNWAEKQFWLIEYPWIAHFYLGWITCSFKWNFILISLHSVCNIGEWRCSENFCPTRCLIEGQFVTTYDGKQYVVPSKCGYVASQVNVSPLPRHLTLTHVVFFMMPTALLKSFLRVPAG